MKKVMINFILVLMLLRYPLKSKNRIMDTEETVKYIVRNKKSIIRFGDGEFRLMISKKGIDYQDYDEKLALELEKIFMEYNINSNYLICVPSFFSESIRWFISHDSKYYKCFSKPRYYFRKKYEKHSFYGDAFVFGKGNSKFYEQLWCNSKNIILVHNDEKWALLLEKKYNCHVDFIKISNKNSYKYVDDIEKKIKLFYHTNKESVILISAGPTAKVIVYRLAKEGIIAFDTGHCFDDPLVGG